MCQKDKDLQQSAKECIAARDIYGEDQVLGYAEAMVEMYGEGLSVWAFRIREAMQSLKGN